MSNRSNAARRAAGMAWAAFALIGSAAWAGQHHAGTEAGGAPAKSTPPAERLDYNRDIRPILSAKCFACHGSDQKSLQAGLRLDLRDIATHKLPSGKIAIIPGKPQQSELAQRIALTNNSLQMPPPSSKKTLTEAEKHTLLLWIAQGAEYKPHWAFVKPVRPPLPPVSAQNAAWVRNPIDRFILAKLEREGLKPSPEADRATLIRRVSLDLTGIPPTPQEVDAFVNDRSPNAYEKVVDRLLASPRYGERMAMSWLDGARYADSNGYQADYERFQWRWRDWVIDAYNHNMPFDQFTIEQIAGDLLPNATLSQKIATGFNRNHRINTEGGVIPEEWRVETVIDRVETTSAVWLGLTAGCARCHDHKYDPISQKEFYQLFAYFNNVPESGTGEERPVNHPPFIKAPTDEQQAQSAQIDARLKRADAQLNDRLAANMDSASRWTLADVGGENAALQKGVVARYALAAQSTVTAGEAPAPKTVGNVVAATGRAGGAIATDGSGYLDLGDVGGFDTHDAFSYSVWIDPANGNGVPVSRMDSRADYRGWDLYVTGGRPAVHIISKWPDNALKVTSRTAIPNGQWSHIAVTYDGSAKPEGVKIYVNGKRVETETEANSLTGTIRTPVSAKIGTRTGSDGYTGKVEDLILYQRALAPDEVATLANGDPARTLLAIAPAQRTEEQKREIARLWSERNDAAYRDLAAVRDAAAKERETLEAQISTVMIMDEMPKPRACTVLVRGEYDKHGETVTAGLPAAFPPLPPGAPNNRLGLALWIASPDNPLTARVAVNRFWEKLFGIGIVATSEDFGTRAEFPSHPELLDWLATEFVRLKWDMKAILKEMVMSATYRQSSRITPELLRRDPENRLLARGPRFRLPAEMIRDQALYAAGLLTEKLGGPSVRPYQPDGIWDEVSVYGNLHNYKHDTGPNLYRRTFYTIWKRTAAPPMLTLFDVPGRETCRVRRSRTNTPLQALVLENDVTYIEAARVLAQRMLAEGGPTPEARIAYACRRLLGRRPTDQETRVLTAGIAKRLAKYRADTAAATKLVSLGDAPRDPKLDIPELAAYTGAASVLLNLDETITKE
jgi:hypothetical protein